MVKSSDQEARHIGVSFEAVTDLVLLHVSGRCAISELFHFELTLFHSDTTQAVNPAEIIGLGVSVSIDPPTGDGTRIYHGVINEFRQVGWSDRGITYRATMVPALWFLTQRNNCRIFQEMKTPEIVEQVLLDAGIEDFELRLSDLYTQREYCVQYRETDFNFVSRLLEEEGIFYYFDHGEDGHTLVLCDAVRHYHDLKEKVHFPKPGQSHPDRNELLTWHERFQFIPGSVSRKDFNFKQPKSDLFRRQSTTVQLPNNSACEIFDYHGRYSDGDTGLHLTEMRMGEFEKNYQTGFATSQLSFFHPAGKFRFGVHCIEARIGSEYVVTSVEIEARASDYVSGTQHTGDDEFYKSRVTCIPADRIFRPDRQATKPFVQGPQTAIVSTNGEEIMVDEHGRVKVQFHWDRYGQFDDASSCWIRVSQTHAGQGWGEMDIPRQHEEVIVSFIEGDPDRPIITGRVYNGLNRPPFDLAGSNNGTNKTRRGNATQTVGGGGFNEMSMDDTPGKEQIRINAQYDLNTTVGNDQTHAVGNNRDLTVGNNESKSVTVDQSLKVGANRAVEVGANHMETVAVAQTVNVGADQSTTVGGSQNNNISANQKTSIGSRQSTQVGLMRNETIGAIANEMVGFTKTINVGVAMNTLVGALNAEETAGIKFIKAGTKFQVECGASKLTMDAAGKITLEGVSLLLKGSGSVKVAGGVIDLN